MWNLIYNIDKNMLVDYFESTNNAGVSTNNILEQFDSEADCLAKIEELGLIIEEEQIASAQSEE